MIKVENLEKNYGNIRAVKGVSFEVEKGEIIGLLGPNAAGKTTIMRIITGYLPPTSGKVEVDGYDVIENPLQVKRRIGYLPENPPLYNDMTVDGFLNFVAEIKEIKKSIRKERIEEVIEETGLLEVRKRLVDNLSRGYKQRVGLATALIHKPPVLILDEPTVGLDPKQIIEIRNLIKSLAKKHTIILSSHILPEVSATCERVIIIHQGEIIAIDTQQDLAKRLRGGERIYLEVKAPKNKVWDKLANLSLVTNISLEKETEDSFSCYIETKMSENLRIEIFKVLKDTDSPIMELRPVSMSLEEVFLKLTTEEEITSENLGNI